MRVRLPAAKAGANALPSHQQAPPFFSDAVYGPGRNGSYAHSKPRRPDTRALEYGGHPLRRRRLALLHMDVSMWGCLSDHLAGVAVLPALTGRDQEVTACEVLF